MSFNASFYRFQWSSLRDSGLNPAGLVCCFQSYALMRKKKTFLIITTQKLWIPLGSIRNLKGPHSGTLEQQVLSSHPLQDGSWVYCWLQSLEAQNPLLVQQAGAWMELWRGQVELTCCVLKRPVSVVKHDVCTPLPSALHFVASHNVCTACDQPPTFIYVSRHIVLMRVQADSLHITR